MVKAGQKAPDFALLASDGTRTRLREFRGKRVILYFYPKDHTPGCTREACDFRDNFTRLNKLHVAVIGVSPDSPRSHQRFAEKHALPFLLLSDEAKEVAKTYGVWKKKKLYGREFMGISRTTFIIDAAGTVLQVFENVKVRGHVERIIEYLTQEG